MSVAPKLAWNRPSTVSFPQIWRIFVGRDVNTDDMIEYRIQDLPVERIEDAVQHMLKNYLKDEPISQALGEHSIWAHFENSEKSIVFCCPKFEMTIGGAKSDDHAADYAMIWRAAFEQNTALVCLSYSGEIIGLNVNYVLTKNETFLKDFRNAVSRSSVDWSAVFTDFIFYGFFVQCKSPVTRDTLDAMALLYRDFDVFERYGVDKYLSSLGLSVDPKYRGRGIGRQLLLARWALKYGAKLLQNQLIFGFIIDKCRKEFCESMDVPLTHNVFSSDISNRLADRSGFKPDVALAYVLTHYSSVELHFNILH